MGAGQARRAFQTLDGLRAVGAFLVVMRHMPDFFGPFRLPESFLAVDLFYLVSGFVVAHAYGERLKAGGFVKTFMKTRLIRLYPLYAVGLAIGVADAVVTMTTTPGDWWTWPRLIEAVVTGVLMIPLFPGLERNGSSLNGPTWTLLPELVANLFYAVTIRFLTRWVLCLIVLVSALGLVLAERHFKTLDVGFGPTEQWAALARVGFSFFVGVLLFRLVGDRKQDSEWGSWACVLALTVAMAFRPSPQMAPYYELGVIILGFPALLVVAGRFEPGAFTGRVFSLLGLISYGVYIIHQPLGHLARAALKGHIIVPPDARGLVVGGLFLLFLLVLAWALDRYYDAPVRRVLRGWFLKDGAPRPTARPAP